jgi:hypothetical protein
MGKHWFVNRYLNIAFIPVIVTSIPRSCPTLPWRDTGRRGRQTLGLAHSNLHNVHRRRGPSRPKHLRRVDLRPSSHVSTPPHFPSCLDLFLLIFT